MFKKAVILFLFILLPVFMSGCVALLAGAAGGAGTAIWLSDKLTQEVNASFEKSIDAVNKALDSMNLEKTREVKQEKIAQIKGLYTDGSAIWIDIRRLSQLRSRIEIRVGMTGGEESARKILDRIMSYL